MCDLVENIDIGMNENRKLTKKLVSIDVLLEYI